MSFLWTNNKRKKNKIEEGRLQVTRVQTKITCEVRVTAQLDDKWKNEDGKEDNGIEEGEEM